VLGTFWIDESLSFINIFSGEATSLFKLSFLLFFNRSFDCLSIRNVFGFFDLTSLLHGNGLLLQLIDKILLFWERIWHGSGTLLWGYRSDTCFDKLLSLLSNLFVMVGNLLGH
jgi:hypothetical protein